MNTRVEANNDQTSQVTAPPPCFSPSKNRKQLNFLPGYTAPGLRRRRLLRRRLRGSSEGFIYETFAVGKCALQGNRPLSNRRNKGTRFAEG